jgi:predicted nuclease of predicted toxin-antitoxin system
MKILLDENLPWRLKNDFSEIETLAVRDMKWEGIKNGELLRQMNEHGFDVLVTFDKNIPHQQNLAKYGIRVVILDAPGNKYLDLRPLVEKVIDILGEPFEGAKIIS